MARRRTTTPEGYRKALTEKYGKDTYLSGFKSMSAPALHTCPKCGVEFLKSPGLMLGSRRYANCLKCSRAITTLKQRVPEKKFRVALKKKFDYIECLAYTTNYKPSKFRCGLCGNEWETKAYELMKLKHGCPVCASVEAARATTHSIEEIREQLKEANPTLRVLDTKRRKDKGFVQVQGECGHSWIASIGNLVHNKTGCPICSKFKGTEYRTTAKFVHLGKRKVAVEGSEHIALKFLLKKVAATKIAVFSEGTIDPVPYTFQSVEREYWPDLKIGPRLLVEVKSTYTLFKDFLKNKAKVAGCNKAGFRIKFLVVVGNRTIVLPKEWTTWKQDKVEAYLRTKTLNSLRVLSLDPGVTNFAWAVTEADRSSMLVLASGMLNNTITDLKVSIKDQSKLFKEEILEIIQEYQVDSIILERFMSRGHGGTTIELVNIMIGVLLGMPCAALKRWKLVTAAQWKNEWNRRADLSAFYSKVSGTVHQVDAIGIGMYGIDTWFDQVPFDYLTDDFQKKLALNISRTSI